MNREEKIRTALRDFDAEHLSSIVVWADPPDAPTRWFARGPAAPELREIDREVYDVLCERHATRAGHEQRIDVHELREHSVSVQCAGAQGAERCGLWLPCDEDEGMCLCKSRYAVFHVSGYDLAHEPRLGRLCPGCGKPDNMVEVGSGKAPAPWHPLNTEFKMTPGFGEPAVERRSAER